MTVAATVLFCLGSASDAYAFKIFGITLFGDDKADADIVDPLRYSVNLDTDGSDRELARAIERSSLLVNQVDNPVSGDLGLVIKARDDRDRLIATLYERARYGGVVTITIGGRNIDDLPPNPKFDRSGPVPVTLRVDPGPVFTLGDIRLQGDAARLDLGRYELRPGGDAGSLVIIKAARQIVDDLKTEGRPLARLTEQQVVADHKSQTVDVVLGAESGPIAPIGPVTISGEKAVDPDFIRRYSRLNQGKPYTPEDIRKASERLRKLGVFSSVTIKESETLAPDGSLPLGITVSEGKHRYFGFGASISTIDGAGLQGYWGHRNLFGQAESLRIEGSVGGLGNWNGIENLDYTAGISFVKPGAFVPSGTLDASIKGSTITTESYDARSVVARLGYSYELSDKDTLSAAATLSFDDIDDAFGNNRYVTFAVPVDYVRDTRDNTLNPTEGYRATLSAAPSYEILEGTIFSSFEGSISGYRGFGEDDRLVLAGKLAAGTLIGGDGLASMPATRRFYAGGGGSVRGYAYQEISPYNGSGDATGGRSYVTGSVEARLNVTDTIGVVPFLDFGTVSTELYPDFSDVRLGAGIGLRYNTAFGPIRLDVALPLDRYDGGSRYGIYAGIGQSF
ncbi:autotransporter secretion outer membrane protein TamA [Ciceribacter lividus]|uniref:Autotransporter secretion outer membrane protein TamA n=1 Tax=Ciceribacter lividus TaxID=1197950 RepID=A0A6I7HP44_9HYPH|nr:autotransporter assembly complex family protein [Ciceribacter lividus]RCW25983.1 autotransporter secretion outer membrane protein TamA [Ciceribacter lividus]